MIDLNFYQRNSEAISASGLISFLEDNVIDSDIEKVKEVTGINKISEATPHEATFLHNAKYVAEIKNTKAALCIISQELYEIAEELNDKMSYVICKNPYAAYAKLLAYFYGYKRIATNISVINGSNIADSAKIADSAIVQPGCCIGANVEIGEDSVIEANAVIKNGVKIGKNVRIGANSNVSYALIDDNVYIGDGCVVGSDGFGYISDHTGHHKIPHLGRVLIAKNVEIGSNTAIDRGSIGDTIIGEGTKIDNLVHLGHNVTVGKHCFLAGMVGVSGSVEIGDFVVFGGQCGVAGHIRVGSFNRFAAKTGITKSIPDNSGDFYGMPATEKKLWQKMQIAVRKLAKNGK